MISREKALEWAKEVEAELGISPPLHHEVIALVNRAYAEGQKDVRERAAECCYIAMGRDSEAIEEAIRKLEIE